MVPRVRRDGAKLDTVPPEEAGEAKAPIVSEAPVLSAPASVDEPEVEQIGGGATVASPIDAVIAQTSEPELPASSAIEGSAPEGAPVMGEVLSAPVGPMPMVAMVDPLVGVRPSQSLI